MPEQQITGFPVRAAPNSRTTKDSENFELLAVNATFDGSAAGVAFLPAVEIVSDAGVVVARHKTGSAVAAGASAEVTFAPFLREDATSNTSSGIDFDKDNEGGYLYAQTNDCVDIDLLPDPLAVGGTWGTVLEDDSGCGLLVGSTSQVLVKGRNAPVVVLADGGNVEIDTNGGNIQNGLGSVGTSFVVLNHLGVPIFQVDEDGTITGPPIVGGIGFEILNSGGWLDIETTDSDPDGWGVQIHDTANDAQGIKLLSDEGEIEVTANDNSLSITANETITITSAAGPVLVFSDGVDGVQMTGGAATGTINDEGIVFGVTAATDFQVISSAADTLLAINDDSTVTLNLAAGKSLTVNDAGGNPIFRVNEDGSLQGKTGKALTFNL